MRKGDDVLLNYGKHWILLLNISEVIDYDLHEATHNFSSFVCEECGEMQWKNMEKLREGNTYVLIVPHI